MNDFHRYLLSTFVDFHNLDPERFIDYYELLAMLKERYQEANLAITDQEICDGITYLIGIGFLEVYETSYRLSPTGKVYWEYNLSETSNLTGEINKAKSRANLALLLALVSFGALVFLYLRP